MALTGAMSAGISGLKTHMEALNTVGNNIANVNTYGYKPGRVTFLESIYSTQSAGSGGTAVVGSTNPRQTGYGVSIGTVDLDMSTQALEATGQATDLFIQGDGFFLVGPKMESITSAEDAKRLSLSRVGNFEFGPDGYLHDGQGNVVYGFLTANTKADGSLSDTAGTNGDAISTHLVPIRLPMKAVGDATDPNATQPGEALFPGVGTDGYNDYPQVGTGADASTGDFIDYSSLKIDENGRITCVNDDTEDPVTIGYIALAKVDNPNGLQHTSGPYFTCGDAAGDITLSAPGSSVTGYLNNQDDLGAQDLDEANRLSNASSTALKPGFLEASGTDLATEFANMIIYQRGYQANTRIVTVTDSMLEELVNMKR